MSYAFGRKEPINERKEVNPTEILKKYLKGVLTWEEACEMAGDRRSELELLLDIETDIQQAADLPPAGME